MTRSAMSGSKKTRGIFYFASEDAALLGYFYPILSVKTPQATEQSTAIGVGGLVSCEAAAYDVVLLVDEGVTVVGSGALIESKPATSVGSEAEGTLRKRRLHHFRGEGLRGVGFALLERVKSLSQQAQNVRLTAYFREPDERLGNGPSPSERTRLRASSKFMGTILFPVCN